ncbi:MAG: cytochrome d ubiquinol oxidase subunit II [Planctomycetota bacterium]
MGPDFFLYAIATALVIYVLTGGADFGGGVWDLFAKGQHRERQRLVIERAIGPIWEVNHIWTIFIVVMLFAVFPDAFAAIGVALHIPLTIAMVGIVLRGSAFTFRSYGLQPDATRRRWGHLFAWTSLVTPVVLGMTLAALASGEIRIEDGKVTSSLLAGWTSPFAIATGVLALVLFSLIAAVYLIFEGGGEFRADFRRKAFATQIVAVVMLVVVYGLAHLDAPEFAARLDASPYIWPLRALIAFLAWAVLAAIKNELDWIARAATMCQVAAVVVGFGLAMGRHLILPDLTIDDAGGHEATRLAIAPALVFGAFLLIPSLYCLFAMFKGSPSSGDDH